MPSVFRLKNAAIKRRIHPKEMTYANIERMRGQLRSMGAMFDWRREAVSSDPNITGGRSGSSASYVKMVGLSQDVTGGLVPQLQHYPGTRASVGG